ncbi:HDIG domain-containing protein [Carboxylicivirga mesophila]|uniref:HDIG domain-containing protein n=1 Tax=Carboxylicivirga mesophila TaxID=1166478 RepID=A0ABS5KE80_9BACT|nr:HDIG domain-containing metalloprotein [Carboxylicivirga mesophila]MBS2213343.1 HDIG domain-containing protein [Carboxylicivirga mesophila]
MLELFSGFKSKFYKPFVRILLFIISIVIVTYLLPKTGKFAYEYQNGTPWKHQTLIAPFDFPIYKTQAELNDETNAALKNYRPYFEFDTSMVQSIKEEFSNDYDGFVNNNQDNYPLLAKGNKDKINYFALLKNSIIDNLNELYAQGIILLPEEYVDAQPSFEMMLIKGTYVEPYELSELEQRTSAYQRLARNSATDLPLENEEIIGEVSQLINSLQLNKYIKANVLINEERSATELAQLRKNISLTSGRVLAGQRIIDQGEIVTSEIEKVLDSLRRKYEANIVSDTDYYFILSGQLLLVALMFTSIYLFLFYFRRDVFNSISSISFILLITLTMVLFASLKQFFVHFPFFIIPFAILPIIIRTFLDSRLAFFMHVITILICAFFAQNSFEFVFIQIPVGLVAMFSLFRMTRRSHIVRTAMLIILTYSLFYTSLLLWQEGTLKNINPVMFAYYAANGVMLLMVYPLIWIFERIFGFLSDVTLIELADTNHPVLREMAEATPGTFQHSIQVGNLAQEVAYKLGANPALVRAGAMYHDIGKMASPLFFTENQAGGLNPHTKLDFEDSARIVINHIDNGVKMAQKHNLPRQIIDFITTHQGTTKTRYFYNSYINKYPEKTPDISAFSYPGPTPFTKETAILMMADSIEAASRSLKSYSDDEIDKLVEKIINIQIEEDQFINAPITFKEITEAKEVFKNKLKNIYHARIEYPDIKK